MNFGQGSLMMLCAMLTVFLSSQGLALALAVVGSLLVVAAFGVFIERWTVPTLLTPGDLLKLQAAACLTIDDDGKLVSFKVVEASAEEGLNPADYQVGALRAAIDADQKGPVPWVFHTKFDDEGRFVVTRGYGGTNVGDWPMDTRVVIVGHAR